jgi:hypothetical protein
LSNKPRTLETSVPDLGDCDFSKLTMPFSAEVTVKTTDWREYSAKVDIPLGAPGRPWEETVAKVKEKFATECKRNLAEQQISKFLVKLYAGDDIPVKELVELATHGATVREEKKAKAETIEDADLPPIIFEPVKDFEKPREESEPSKIDKNRSEEAKAEKKGTKVSVVGRMRRAKPGEKPPKPPKSAPRKRPRRP